MKIFDFKMDLVQPQRIERFGFQHQNCKIHVDVGINEEITAVIWQDGSVNGYQSIEACNKADVTMVYTGQRSFKP